MRRGGGFCSVFAPKEMKNATLLKIPWELDEWLKGLLTECVQTDWLTN